MQIRPRFSYLSASALVLASGAPLAEPTGARALSYGGRRFAVLRSDGALVFTWQQGGHTCVLASRAARLERLLAMAAWS